MCYYISRSASIFWKDYLGTSKFKIIPKKTYEREWKCDTIVDFLLAILQNLPITDFCCCFSQDDRVLKLLNTFTSGCQLLTNMFLIKKVCM